MTIGYKEKVITQDTNIFGVRSLRESLTAVKPPLIKLDPGNIPASDSVKIYPEWSKQTHQEWYKKTDVIMKEGDGVILIGPQINQDPICQKNDIYWGVNRADMQRRRKLLRGRKNQSTMSSSHVQ